MLNQHQKKGVETVHGKILILAGAGSGKTSVLVHRISYLIEQCGAGPESILGLTFTNKAAQEMKERVAAMVGHQTTKKITLSTFHSFCMSVLRREIHHLGYTRDFSLYDEKDMKRVFTSLIRQELVHEGELPSIDPTIRAISAAKQKGLSLEEFKALHSRTSHDKLLVSVYEELPSSMRAYNAVDFDSLLTLTVELFEKFPSTLERYQHQYRYVMIDEYQDTNPVQDKLAFLIAGKHGNLCVVGDDDQSIYGWRGAEVKNILRFPADTTIKLEENFRSTPNILDAANHVIRNNKERYSKSLWSTKDRGPTLILFHAATEIEEARTVVERMIMLHQRHGLKWSDMAILYRSNLLARIFETELLQTVWKNGNDWVRGIPYRVFGGIGFFERAEVKDVLAYLRAINNPLDQEALLRIINVPRRGISEATLDILTSINRKKNISLWEMLKTVHECSELSDRAQKSVSAFVTLLEEAKQEFQEGPLHNKLKWLMEKIDYKSSIKDDAKSDKMRELKWDNVLECIETLKAFEEKEEHPTLSDFISNATLVRDDPIRDREHKENAVSLMTFHSAKGLEFPACFLIALEDTIVPHERSIQEGNIEEERRLLYVAMTRAKTFLTLSVAQKRRKMGKETYTEPSPFLFEIPKELLKITQAKNVSYLDS